MHHTTFTIVIPTLDRADVLRSALATCVSQDDASLRILVSDNASTDATPRVVEAFSDPRIRYVNPGRRLGMPEHWEFALSHVTPGFVSVLGDDDGLLPGAVRRARSILESAKVDAVAWRKAEYHWPDHIVPESRNWLQIPLRRKVDMLRARKVLSQVLQFRRTYTDLPCIYNSFVATSVLDSIRRTSGGRLLPCITPDIYSGIAVATMVDRYAFSHSPLSVNAASRYSNGTITSFRGMNDRQAVSHFTSSAERIHPSLVKCPSVPVLIADAAFAARANLAGVWLPEVDVPAMLRLSLRYAEERPRAVYEETLQALDEIARRTGYSATWASLRGATSYSGAPGFQPLGWSSDGSSLAIDGTALRLRNVADAALCVEAVLCCINKAGVGAASSSIFLDYLPQGVAAEHRPIWADFLSRIADSAPPAPAEGLRRYWRGAMRRLRALVQGVGR